MAARRRQAADRQGETWLHNHYYDGWMVCISWSTWYSCILINLFHPWMTAECEGVNMLAAACGDGGGVSTEAWPAAHDALLHPCHHLYRTLLCLIVSVGHPVCSVIGQSTCLMLVRNGLSFSLSFAIIILRSWKMYFAFIHACKWTNTVCWLCV